MATDSLPQVLHTEAIYIWTLAQMSIAPDVSSVMKHSIGLFKQAAATQRFTLFSVKNQFVKLL